MFETLRLLLGSEARLLAYCTEVGALGNSRSGKAQATAWASWEEESGKTKKLLMEPDGWLKTKDVTKLDRMVA